MRILPLAAILLVACSGSNTNTGDAPVDTVAETTDTIQDSTPDSTPDDTVEDISPDVAPDVTPDADEDTPADTTTDGIPECESLGGTCVGLVAGCTVCASGSLPYHSRRGCPEPEWCCMPGTPGTTDCEVAGGVCIPVIPEATCPPGWGSVYTACSGEGSGCCMPSDSCA